MQVLPSAMEAEREWGKKSRRMMLLADQTRVPGKEGDSRLTQRLSNHGTICLRNMEPGIKKQNLGLTLVSL